MKTWSKYIIFIITIFAIFLCKGETLSSKNNHINLIEQLEDVTESLSTDFTDSSLPPSSVFTNTHRSHKNIIRRDNLQRNNFHLLRTNKITNLNSTEYIINKFTHKNTTLSELTTINSLTFQMLIMLKTVSII